MKEFEKYNNEDILKIENEDTIAIMKLNSEISKLDLSKHYIELEIDKLEQYIKTGEGKSKFVIYIDVDESREIEIESKKQAIANFNEMIQLVQYINEDLKIKNARSSDLVQEIIRITALKSSKKNNLRKEIKKEFDESILGINSSYQEELDKSSEEEKILDKFHNIFFDEHNPSGADYIRKRCMEEIEEIKIAPSSKIRESKINKIINGVYDSWTAQLLDILKTYADDKNYKIEIPDTLESVKQKIDELLPGVDSRFKKNIILKKERLNIPSISIADLELMEQKIINAINSNKQVSISEKEDSTEEKENDKTIKVNIRSLPLKSKEKLQADIVKWIENYRDQGKGKQEQAYKQLAIKSKDELGYQLTKGQIEGQYKRHVDEFRQQ
jgi:hypothetical protein